MPTQRLQPAGLASLPATLKEQPLIDLRREVERALVAIAKAQPHEREGAELTAINLSRVIVWCIATPAAKAYGQEASNVVHQWASYLRDCANGLDRIQYEETDRTAVILDNLENIQRQISDLASAVISKRKQTRPAKSERRAAA